MIIRKATINDARVIAENNVILARESEGLDISYSKTLAGVNSLIRDKGKGFYLVAEDKEGIIGELMITFEWSDWSNKYFWWIQSVFVIEEFRKQGVFRRLLSEVFKLAKIDGVDVVRLYVYNKNVKAISVYESVGMVRKPYLIFQFDRI